jgi:sugar diacid utilization regulator
MEWLAELQQIVGKHVRVEKGSGSRERTGPFLQEEEWLPLDNGEYLVVDKREMAHETVELIRLLAEKERLSRSQGANRWFRDLVHNKWPDAGAWSQEVRDRKWEIPLPSVIAVLEMNRGELDATVRLLEEMLSDRHPDFLTKEHSRQVWMHVLWQREPADKLRQAAAQWLDTLSAELYIEVRLGISRPVLRVEDLPGARREAEVALQAGSSFLPRQRIFQYDNLGYAHLLYGVERAARDSFLQEVLPMERERALTQELRETIQTFANSGQNIAETSRALYIHRNTLLYRLDKIHELTGLDIRKFQDLLVLWTALMLRQGQSVRKQE